MSSQELFSTPSDLDYSPISPLKIKKERVCTSASECSAPWRGNTVDEPIELDLDSTRENDDNSDGDWMSGSPELFGNYDR